MERSTVGPAVFQENYEEAVRKLSKQSNIAVILILLIIFVAPFISHQLEVYVFFPDQGVNDLSKINDAQGDFRLFSGAFIIFLLFLPFWYLRTVSQNPILSCPRCSKLLAPGRISIDVLKTGMCPFCRQMILEDTLFSKSEALMYYCQQEQARIRREKVCPRKAAQASKRMARLCFVAGILYLLAVAPVYLWIKSLEEVMGKEAALRNAGMIVVFSLLLLLLSWLCLSEKRRLEQQLEKPASQPEGHHGSENSPS